MSKLKPVAWVALALPLFSALAIGQANYPNRPVKMIVPFAPGGASDFVARIISPKLGELLGQTIVIENRPGASGNIGMEAAAKAAADGYTIYLGNIGTIAINPAVFPNLSINPQKDFTAITLVAGVPSILIANPSVPANTVAELVALAKSKPGELNFASPGSSTLNRLEMERFMKFADLKIVHIPYKGGAGPAVTGMLGGETQVMFVTLSSAISFVQAGRLKPLGISTTKRIDALPQVPTMIEAGYPEMVSSSWQGVFVPAGTPRPTVEKIHSALLATMDSPEVKQRFAGGGVDVMTSKTPEDFAAFVAAETARWGKVAKESGATVD
ncbi:MAG: tripartite tricarboxylate transporter substrate binding protein [Betaproteobacteria bacterium]|nr:MAG: tripartite tricarboxylate transporter substrate binding protein [Betaproteobacteria bacterium]